MRQREASIPLDLLRTGFEHFVGQRMHGAYRDFLLIFLATVSLFLLIGIEPWLGFLSPLRLLLGFAFVLFFPGYCLAAAMFPQSSDLDGIGRIGLSLGLSIAWVPVLALLLSYLPPGLDLWSIALGEALSILIFAVVATSRRSRVTDGRDFAPGLVWDPREWWHSLSVSERRIQAIIAAALLVGGLSVTWVLLTPSSSEVTTELYMLGSDGMAESFPRDAVVGESLTITLGVTNRELEERSYRVEVWVQDSWMPDRRQRVASEGSFLLVRDESREWPISWNMPWTGHDQKVEFLLFVGERDVPYRRVYFYLDVEQ